MKTHHYQLVPVKRLWTRVIIVPSVTNRRVVGIYRWCAGGGGKVGRLIRRWCAKIVYVPMPIVTGMFFTATGLLDDLSGFVL
jgi:hypothetical protein